MRPSPAALMDLAAAIGRRYARRYAALYLAGRGECDADDLAQEAALRVWKDRDRIAAASNRGPPSRSPAGPRSST